MSICIISHIFCKGGQAATARHRPLVHLARPSGARESFGAAAEAQGAPFGGQRVPLHGHHVVARGLCAVAGRAWVLGSSGKGRGGERGDLECREEGLGEAGALGGGSGAIEEHGFMGDPRAAGCCKTLKSLKVVRKRLF